MELVNGTCMWQVCEAFVENWFGRDLTKWAKEKGEER
jgi:hypothetical protein